MLDVVSVQLFPQFSSPVLSIHLNECLRQQLAYNSFMELGKVGKVLLLLNGIVVNV